MKPASPVSVNHRKENNMPQLRDIVRAKVDEYRLSEQAGQRSREDVVAAMAAEFGQAQRRDAQHDEPLHRCPWSTCQATRHN
jgi:hypothetical protein